MGLGVLMGIYTTLQQTVALEGNRLYTGDATLVDAAPAKVVSLLSSADVEARIYQSVSENGRTRAMLEFGSPSGQLPIHDGRQFSAADTRAAMVGADVPVRKVGPDTLYVLDGIDYPVIARLGRKADSLLSGDVLIRDPGYFTSSASGSVVIDGAEAVDVVTESLGPDALQSLSSDTLRRTNIDYVSPILRGFGWALAVLGCLTTAVLAARYVQPRNTVDHQLGHARRKILLRRTGQLIGVVALAAAPVIALSAASSHAANALDVTAGLALLVVATFTAATARTIWGRPAWM